MAGDKIRLRFAKTGTLRLLSHHDLMRCLERMLRRADLPFKCTAGFHPNPRIVFALSLPLGVVGLDEVLEIEFTRELDAEDVRARLDAAAPEGLRFTRAGAIPMRSTAIPRRVVYRFPLPVDRAASVAERCRELLHEPKVWVDRLHPSLKSINIRPYFRNLTVSEGEDRAVLLDLWVTQTGTARADEVLELLGVEDLTDAGSQIERTTLELRDETANAGPPDSPPDGPAETRPLDPVTVSLLTRRSPERSAAALCASLSGPIVE
ncbi:MAG TPA: TIGR03936 family radical SAM-associated protein [Gemmata sp.]|nr:TIGR03936 family radical SAM-associated protein [Gemmata sp.]